jgi:hypothetical protein
LRHAASFRSGTTRNRAPNYGMIKALEALSRVPVLPIASIDGDARSMVMDLHGATRVVRAGMERLSGGDWSAAVPSRLAA